MEEEGPTVSSHEFSIAYNGESRLDDHTMDVEILAPALLAFGKLLRGANAEANGKNSKAKVFVTSDFQNNCFQVDFDLLITVFEQVKMFIGSGNIQTAKEILEWIGLLKPASAAGAGYLTYLGYMKWKNGRKVTSIEQENEQDGKGMVSVMVEGDNNSVHVTNNTFQLSNDQLSLKATRMMLGPIGSDQFDSLELKEGGTVRTKINHDDAVMISASCNSGLAELSEREPDVDETSAWLSPYSPVFDESAEIWRFNYGREHIYVDISETDIAQKAKERGMVSAGDAYQVRLKISTPIDAEGKPKKPSYKISEVVKFIPAEPLPTQVEMDQSLFE